MEILDEVLKHIPDKSKVSDSGFEGANIILYTKDKDFLLNSNGLLKEIVNSIKKRVELRPDPSIAMDMEKAKTEIEKLIPSEAGLASILFDPQRSLVTIEAEKPGLVIGKQGDLLKEIKRKTLWVPIIRRTPAIKSKIIENIRHVLYENNDYRKKFLNKVGKRIYGEWAKNKQNEWVRISILGAGRQVGRSCFLLQTPESRVLLDCGINVAAQNSEQYPMLEAPEFNLEQLDAVILSHPHVDHCLPPHTLVELEDGIIKPIDDVKKGDKLVSIDWKTNRRVISKCINKTKTISHKTVYKIHTPYYTIESSPNHRFFTLNGYNVKEVRADELKKGMIIPAQLGKSRNIKQIELKPVSYNERLSLSGEAIQELKETRKKLGWTQNYIRKKLNKGVNFLYKLENKSSHILIGNLKELLWLYNIKEEQFFDKHTIPQTNYPAEITNELAQCVGYFTGDGHESSPRSLRITDKSTACLNEYKSLFSNLFNYNSKIRKHPDKTKNAFQLNINNKGILKYLKTNFDTSFNKSRQKLIPNNILFSSDASVKSFLRGFFDAEGAVLKNSITFGSSSNKMLETIQFLLSTLGIPATISYKYQRVSLSSVYSLKNFYKQINFTHPTKKIKLRNLLKRNGSKKGRTYEFLPINSDLLNNIFSDVRIKGRIHHSPNIDNLPLGLVALYRSKESYAERKTVTDLLKVLNERRKELKKVLNLDSLQKKRVTISLSKKELSKISKVSEGRISVRENKFIYDNYHKNLIKKLNSLIKNTILKTNYHIKNLNKILDSDIFYQKITKNEKIENPYDYLVDIEVDKTHSFIANGLVVHNSGFIPWLFKMGYNGPVYTTEPSRDIAALLALDIIGVSQKEAEKSLYSSKDVKEMVKHTIPLDYEEVTDITPDIRITLYNAGHTLGSAVVHIHIGNGAHNLVYSLDGKNQVVSIDKDEDVSFNQIGELIDNQFKKYPALARKKDIYEELVNVEGIKTISFNPQTYKSEIKEITSFIRHPINEDLFEIKTASGRKITVTGSHSLFTVKNGLVESIPVSELNKGNFIIGPKKIPTIDKIPHLNLISHLGKLRIHINDQILLDTILDSYKEKIKKLPKKDSVEANNWLYDFYKFGMYKSHIAKKYKIHKRKIRRVFDKLGIIDHPRVNHSLPAKFTISKDFARFLGYYVAEGYCDKRSQCIRISNQNNKILKDAQQIIKKEFGINSFIYREKELIISSKQIKYLIKKVLNCGVYANEKRVPSQILLSSKEITSNFLYGYLSGDGGIRVKTEGREISFSSKSKQLIQDVTFLLLQFNLVPRLTYNNYTKIYIGSIYNAQKIEKLLLEIDIINKNKKVLKFELQNMKKKKGSFDMRIPILALSQMGQIFLLKTAWRASKTCNTEILKQKDQLSDLDKKIIDSDFMFDQIKKIRKVKPTGKYVYDFKIEGTENFLGGEGFLFTHNTGDYKFLRTQLLEPAVNRFPRVETIITEATYGAKEDILPSRASCEEDIVNTIKRTIERNGKVLIPVLGVGRSQEIMLILEQAIREGKLEKIPVYVQGMVWDITAIHTAYPDYLNRNVRKSIFHRDHNPFLSDIFMRIGSKKEQDQLVEETGPCVIMATSGMMVAGASVEYFRRLADNPKNTIMFVNYLGEGSLGRRIQNGESEVQVPSEKGMESVKVQMEVKTISGLSGHAGRAELIRYLSTCEPRPKKVIIVHGESSKCLDLASSIHKSARIETNAPKNLEAIRLR